MRSTAVVLALVALVACGGPTKTSSSSAPPSTVATTTTEGSTTTTTRPEFPREVPIASITDSRIRKWATMSNKNATVVVEVAAGVYADRGQSPDVGTVDDYGGVYGLCADVKPFATQHHAGYTCW